MNFRTITGSVNCNGSIQVKSSGEDFIVERADSGKYIVVFNTPFAEAPTVVLTQNYPAWNSGINGNGETTDNAVLVFSRPDSCGVVTGDGDGTTTDRNFCFIAIGPG